MVMWDDLTTNGVAILIRLKQKRLKQNGQRMRNLMGKVLSKEVEARGKKH